MLYTESLKFISFQFSLNSLRRKGKARMETFEGFVNFVHFLTFLDERTGSIAGMHIFRANERDNWTLKVNITVHKANCIKRMSQTRTPGQSKSCFGKRQF